MNPADRETELLALVEAAGLEPARATTGGSIDPAAIATVKLLNLAPGLAVAVALARALRRHDCMGTIALDSDAIEGCGDCDVLRRWDEVLGSIARPR